MHEQTYAQMHGQGKLKAHVVTLVRVFSFEKSTRSFGVHDVLRVATSGLAP